LNYPDESLAVLSPKQEKCAGIGKVETYPASQSKIYFEASAADWKTIFIWGFKTKKVSTVGCKLRLSSGFRTELGQDFPH